MAESSLTMLMDHPDEVARTVAAATRRLPEDITASELVYSPLAGHSYYRDLVVNARGLEGAAEARTRLERHAEQAEVMRSVRARRAWNAFGDAGVEYRVIPDRTDGTGGYFSPPAWLNHLFATANRPGRVLASLMSQFPLPPGVSSVKVPIIGTGTRVAPAADETAVSDEEITDSESMSQVVPFSGDEDVALQLLEQSPIGAHLDWAIFSDLSEAYDADLETSLLAGRAGTATDLLGVTNVSGVNAVTYSSESPKGTEMFPYLGQVAAKIGKARRLPPECWLMTTSRWAWYQSSEDTGERPFGLSPIFLGKDEEGTPDPIGGVMGWPVFLNDAIPTTQGAGANEDVIICLRPRDLILLEGVPRTLVAREPLSGSLGVRLQMHCNVAALTGRRPAGIGVLSGTGMAVQEGF